MGDVYGQIAAMKLCSLSTFEAVLVSPARRSKRINWRDVDAAGRVEACVDVIAILQLGRCLVALHRTLIAQGRML
jgi:phage FluMu protein gp41